MIQFKVNGMGCNSCVRKIKQAIQAQDPDATVEVDLISKSVKVVSPMPGDVISGIIVGLGYHPQTEA